MSPEATVNVPHPSSFIFDVSAELLDYLPSALGILALDGTVRAVNRAALKLLNFHTSAVIGRHFSYFLRSLDPPLLAGGFQKLLELGSATFDIALRGGGERFVQVEIQLVVIYDEQARQSGVLVMSGEGDAENILLRRAVAKLADQVSRMVAYGASNESLWSKLFALCQELFETPGGWLILRGAHEQPRIPFTFGPLPGQLDRSRNGVTIDNCPCNKLSGGGAELCAVNCMDCPWLAPAPDSSDPMPRHHAVAPILNNAGERIGDICLITPPGRIFHRHELTLMDAITDQIGQALDRGEIHLPERFGSLDRFSPLGIDNTAPELVALLEQILENLAALVPFASAGVLLQERDGLRLMVAVNHPKAQNLRGQFFPYVDNLLNQEITRTKSLIILDDVRQDSRFQVWGGLDYIRGWMGLPLVVNDTVIGLITVDSERVGGFSQRDGEVAQAFADQAAIAVEKARLAVELRRDKRNLELLYQLSQSLAATLEPQTVAEKALELVTAAFNNCFGEIYVAESDEEFLQLLAARNHPPHVMEKLPNQPYLRIGVGIVGGAVEMRRPVLVPNVAEDPRWMWLPDLDSEVRSLAAVPLIARDEVVGALVLSSLQIDVFTPEYLPLLQSTAVSVALALQNARLFAAERHRRQEAEMLRNATSAVTLDLRLEQILCILLERLRQVVHFDSASVMLLEGKELHALAEIGLARPDEVLGRRFPVDNSFFADIQREQRAIFFDDVQKLLRFSGWGGTSTTRGWMGVPLFQRGEALGYITLDSLQVGSYGEREASLAQAFANQMAITIVNAQLLQDSQQAAFEQQEVSGMLRGLNGAVSLGEIRAAVASGLHRLIGASALEIALYQEDEQQVSAERSYWTNDESSDSTSAVSYGFDESAALSSLLQGQSHISPNVPAESQWRVEREWAEQGYRLHIALPLRGSDSVLGHIQLFWRDQLAPAQAIHFSLRQICDGVAMAVERLTLLQQATRRADELQMLIRLSGQLRTTTGRAPITQISLATCLDVFHADQGYVLVPAADEEALEVIAQMGKKPIAISRYLGFTDSIAGRVFSSGIPYRSPNLLVDPLAYRPTVQQWGDSGLTFVSALYAPLRAGDQIVGVLTVANTETRRSFSPTDLRLLNAIAEIVGGALHRATILEELEERVNKRTADLAQANARLLELDQMKSDFVANVSHELRTPLTNIKLYLDLLGSGRPERREHYLQVVQGETDQLHNLIESILDLSALDENRADRAANFETVSLHEVMETIFNRFRQQAAAANLHFDYLPAPHPLAVWGNRERLLQMATNLVSNAINYTRSGGRVELALDKNDQGEAGIVVRDTGIGIAPDEIAHIFGRFYRGSQVKQSAMLGTGLGLSIVNEIIQAHGGRIAVESVPDMGTTFTVWFPLTATD
ncbi:MAG: GAF domain-containing protein [Chloroflexi bacterium]|nr:GAF domain-containing protein [Chloroflexota bacterium]